MASLLKSLTTWMEMCCDAVFKILPTIEKAKYLSVDSIYFVESDEVVQNR